MPTGTGRWWIGCDQEQQYGLKFEARRGVPSENRRADNRGIGFVDFQITVLDLSNFGLHLEQGLNTDVDTRSVAEVNCDRPVRPAEECQNRRDSTVLPCASL